MQDIDRNSKPLISVLMPAYNAEKYISNAVESILNQTYINWELLICDDASTDETRKKLLNYEDSRIRTFVNEKNIGYLKTVNFLFSKANGQYITFQDADDWSELNRLELQIKAFTNNSKLGICGTFAQYYDQTGQKKTTQKILEINHSEIRHKIISRNQFCGASIMIPKSVYLEVRGYRDFFDRIGNEDYDWSARIVEKYESANIPEFLYNVRQSPNSITRKIRSPKQLISEQMVRLLINQRKQYKQDELESGSLNEINKLVKDIMSKDEADSSFLFRKSADLAWYNRNMSNYWYSSLRALTKNPFHLLNIKYFLTASIRIFRFK